MGDIQVVYRPVGGSGYLEFEQLGNVVSFEDDELTMNLKKRERDNFVLIDICEDAYGGLIGVHGAEKYLAQIYIPAREYVDEEIENPDYDPEDPTSQQYITTRTAVPFDISKCILTLWAKEA